jgi:hypothetical protein
MDGGEEGVDSHVMEDHVRRIGATIMGRRMFSGGDRNRILESPTGVAHLRYRAG